MNPFRHRACSWTVRMLGYVDSLVDSHMEAIPSGMLTPDVLHAICENPDVQGLLRLQQYLLDRVMRGF